MKRIYEAAHAADAHLVKQLLEHAGIPAHLHGEYLQGALGELPVSGMIGVQVAEPDAERARRIVEEWQQGIPSFPDDAAETDDADAAPAPPLAPTTNTHRSWLRAAAVFATGAALGATVAWASLRGPSVEGSAIDRNRDGMTDERAYFSGGVLDRVEIDRNRDGAVDSISHYDRNGDPDRVVDDDDFDRHLETTHHYRQGLWSGITIDDDGDGKPEYRAQTAAGVIYLEEWLTPDGAISKSVFHVRGRPSRSDIDSDGDGRLDTRRHYDARGEIVRSVPLAPAR